ncbi:amidohydrolase 3 [Scenedesmus sp. NREL 46B-D3]|nr:amidohydrolase 3 [Scenedesmus sp. NREL 46B-D3]
MGAGWSEANWGGEMPDASWIDEAAAGHPVFLTRMDYHMALVNTAALQLAGMMDGAVRSVEGGVVDRDPATGLPTGLLRERAMDLVLHLIPSPSLQQRRAALAAASSYLLARGVTSVGDVGWGVFGSGDDAWPDLEQVYDAAVAAGEMPVRVSSYVPLRTWRRAAERLRANGTHHASGRLIWGGVKEFADGSLGSSTAVFWSPYADDPTNSYTGTRLIALDDLQQLAQNAAGAGLQIAVHAIGDRAMDEVLEVFEHLEGCREPERAPDAARKPGAQHLTKCTGHRVEHVQHISSSVTAAKLAVLGVHAVPNPQHLIADRAMLVPKLGPVRAGAGHTHAYRTLATMGVSMGMASDWPVVEVDPFASVYAAVFRAAPPQGNHTAALPWAPEEAVPLEMAMQLHTAAAAKVVRLEQWAGQLRPGCVETSSCWTGRLLRAWMRMGVAALVQVCRKL